MHLPHQLLEEQCGIKGSFNKLNQKIPFKLNKQLPENFIVKELINKNLQADSTSDLGKDESGLFIHCILQKRLIDTPGAIKLLSKELNIPNDWIGYAGLKDSHGITSQRISIFNTKIEALKQLNFSNFSLINFSRKKYEINLGDLWGNRFIISMDRINDPVFQNSEKKSLTETLHALPKYIFPNFFGLQRFGGTRPISHQIGKFLLKNDYELAVKTYLTATSNFENEKITLLRKNLSQNWDYKIFLNQLPKNYHYEFVMAQSLLKFPNNYFRAFHEIPLRMKKFFISSYQSYIFNELLSKYLENFNSEDKFIEKFPLISNGVDFSYLPDYLEYYLNSLLEKEDVNLTDFRKVSSIFKSNKKHFRDTFISLSNFEYHLDKQKLVLTFSLPKSSYATMVIRELDGRNSLNLDN